MWNSKTMSTLLTVVLSLSLCFVLMAGCEERKVTTQTEVHDKLLGGKEVKEKQVIQQGDKVQVREKETDIDHHGNIEEQKTTVQGDKLK